MIHSETYPPFFARFYDVLYHQIRTEDVQYFVDLMKKSDGPVLDVGVGTGRFFLQALEANVDVYGVDVSPAMVDILYRRLAPEHHHRIEVGDICSFEPGRKFKLILAPFRMFSHLLTTGDQMKMLENVHRLLLPGGRFVFDLFVPNLKMLLEGLQNHLDFDGEYAPGLKLQRYSSMKADRVRQVSEVSFRLVWDENGTRVEESWSTKIRFFFYYELVHMLERSPFRSYRIFGDFRENNLTASSQEFLIHCMP